MTTPIAPRPLMPRQPVPPRQLPTLDHGLFDLSADAAPNFTLARNHPARGAYAGPV